MQIIIVGCGKVGRTLAEQLQEEESDITLIDVSSNVITSLQDDIDAMGIVGNGASINTLVEAGIENADILIAVTGSDEMNLLCCLIAQKTGHCQTIARVRNPIYNNEIAFLREELGLAMIINPELSSAAEIARIFQFPSAVKIDTFSKGRIDKAKELKILVLEVHFCFVVVVEPFLVENTVFRVDRFILFLRVKGGLTLCHLHDHQVIVRKLFLPENFCPGQHLFPVCLKELSRIFLMVFIRQVSEDIFPLLI